MALVEKHLLKLLKIPFNGPCKTQAVRDLCGGRGVRDTARQQPLPSPTSAGGGSGAT